MLELCRQKGFVLVTGTRRKLQELIRDEKSVTSEFWQVFEVVKLGPLEDSDIQALVVSIERTEFQPSGLAELANWTGRIPVLVLWLLNRLQHEIPTSVVTNEHVNAAATKLDEQATDLVERIWADVPVPAADLFHHLTEVKECLFATAGKAERSLLGEMGLARQIDNKLQLSCRLMAHHVSESAPSTGLVGKLFGTWESYQTNIRGILERRFAQLPCFDATLFHMVAQGIGDIPAYPDVCLNNLTHIEERALDLIWERELGPDRKLTQEVVNYWTENPKSGNRFVREMMDSDQWEVKAERGKQLALLQLLTGSHQDFTRAMAKHTSKDTYVLLNAIHSFRNRNQHSGGQQIDVGVAVSAIMLCIELLGCLARTAPKKV